jgi:hypothetical protein
MGDLPEPQFARNATNTSIMSILTNTLSRSATNSSEYSQAIRLLKVFVIIQVDKYLTFV